MAVGPLSATASPQAVAVAVVECWSDTQLLSLFSLLCRWHYFVRSLPRVDDSDFVSITISIKDSRCLMGECQAATEMAPSASSPAYSVAFFKSTSKKVILFFPLPIKSLKVIVL